MTDTPDETVKEAGTDAPRRNARLARWLIRAMSAGALKREAASMARDAGIRTMLNVAAVLLWIVVAGFLVGAFVVWLSGVVGAIPACAIIAGVLALVAVILRLIAVRMARRRRSWHVESPLKGLAEAMRNSSFDDNALGALALVAIAGFFVGSRGRH